MKVRTQNNKNIFEEKDKVGALVLADSKNDYKTTVIKTVVLNKDRDLHKGDKVEDS